MSGPRRIVIDAGRCVGNGRCYTLAPDLVEDDERGYGTVIGDGVLEGDALEQAERAVRACPEGAVHLVVDEGTAE
jgi:ferredoxin